MDFDALIGRARAKSGGMTYAMLTTKHHDGFCPLRLEAHGLQPRALDALRTRPGCRIRRGLPQTRDEDFALPFAQRLDLLAQRRRRALERPDECHQKFIDYVHGQIREIMTNYGPVDIMWYDGWWPFKADGWQAEKLNAMVRSLQPGILVNNRCCLRAATFGTPEGHITEQKGMWEACMTLNDHWGFPRGRPQLEVPAHGDRNAGQGVGRRRQPAAERRPPKATGPSPTRRRKSSTRSGRGCTPTARRSSRRRAFRSNPLERGDARSDFSVHGQFHPRATTRSTCTSRAGREARCESRGVECNVTDVEFLAGGKCDFTLRDQVLTVTGLPETMDTTMPVVLKFSCSNAPCIYRCGGWREPTVPHCRYDPITPDILY